jgi:hypothetical protein
MNANDTKIMELKKQIEIKKEKLKKSEKFSPVTNCSLEFEGKRHNIHALQKPQIVELLVKLNTYNLSAKDLGLVNEFKIGGFSADEWITDLRAKLDFASRKEEEIKLKAMESKLHQLLSNDKKVELEIEEIANMLD